MNDGAVRLRSWMDQRGLKQQQFAELVGTRQTTVSSWLSGAMPKIRHALKIHDVTGIPLEAWAMPAKRESLPPTGT